MFLCFCSTACDLINSGLCLCVIGRRVVRVFCEVAASALFHYLEQQRKSLFAVFMQAPASVRNLLLSPAGRPAVCVCVCVWCVRACVRACVCERESVWCVCVRVCGVCGVCVVCVVCVCGVCWCVSGVCRAAVNVTHTETGLCLCFNFWQTLRVTAHLSTTFCWVNMADFFHN